MTLDELVVVPLTEDDWDAARALYAAGTATGHATFETEPPTWETSDAKTHRGAQ